MIVINSTGQRIELEPEYYVTACLPYVVNAAGSRIKCQNKKRGGGGGEVFLTFNRGVKTVFVANNKKISKIHIYFDIL